MRCFVLCFLVVVVLANAEDSTAMMIEAQKLGLMSGEYVFLLVQQFEVSGKVVSVAGRQRMQVNL